MGETPVQSESDLQLSGGTDADTDTLTGKSSVEPSLTLSRDRLAVNGGTGTIDYADVDSLTFDLAAFSDRIVIDDTAVATTVNTAGGDDEVTVNNATDAVTINVGDGIDAFTVNDTQAAIAVNGDGDGVDTLTVERSTQTAAVNGRIEDDANPATDNAGQVSDVTAGAIAFNNVEQVKVNLGTGNDALTIDNTLTDTAVSIDGGEGDEQITVLSIGEPETNITGNNGEDTTTVVIKDFPEANQFTSLNLDVETLEVDNRENTTTPVAWQLVDGELLSADTIPSSGLFPVINTAGADKTTILGGTQGDTFFFEPKTAYDINGTIDATTADGEVLGRVELRSGLNVLEPNDFDTFLNFETALGFDALTNGSQTYTEDGFQLTTTGTFVRNDVVSPAVQASDPSDTFTLTIPSDNPNDPGSVDAFSAYTIALALTGTGSETVTFTGTTITCGTVEQTFEVSGSEAELTFQTFEFLPEFTALRSLTWQAGSAIVDNIVVEATLPAGDDPTNLPDGGTPNLEAPINLLFNTNTGQIQVDGAAITDGQFNGTNFTTVVIDGGAIRQFRFAGDFVIPDSSTVTATGDRGLSILVANDAIIGDNVTFDVSANGTDPGVGGGSGGDGGSGGSGGSGYIGGRGGGQIGRAHV